MILIDMEMPTGCKECRLRAFIITATTLEHQYFCTAVQETRYVGDLHSMNKRPNWCPLIPYKKEDK